MMLNAAALTQQYLRLRDELLDAHPELREDEQTLTDTLDGETELTDTVSRFIRQALEDEDLAEALNARKKDMEERRTRLMARADKRRAVAMALMDAVGMRKLEQPDFTAGVRNTPAKVVVTDEAAIPDNYCKITRAPNKLALRDALERGQEIPGVSLGNGSQTLSVRTR